MKAIAFSLALRFALFIERLCIMAPSDETFDAIIKERGGDHGKP